MRGDAGGKRSCFFLFEIPLNNIAQRKTVHLLSAGIKRKSGKEKVSSNGDESYLTTNDIAETATGSG